MVLWFVLNVCPQVKHSSTSLFSYLKAQQNNSLELERLCQTIVEIFRNYQYVDRVTVPLFIFLDRLFSSGCVRSVLKNPQSTFASDIFHHLKLETGKKREVTKLKGSVDVLCHLIQVGSFRQQPVLVMLSLFLSWFSFSGMVKLDVFVCSCK